MISATAVRTSKSKLWIDNAAVPLPLPQRRGRYPAPVWNRVPGQAAATARPPQAAAPLQPTCPFQPRGRNPSPMETRLNSYVSFSLFPFSLL